MTNLNNYNFNKIDAFLSSSGYYDFYLAQDDYSAPCIYDGIVSGSCLVAHYDFNNANIYLDSTQYDFQYTQQYGTIVDTGLSQYTTQYGYQYGSVVGRVDTIYSLTTWEDAVNTGYIIPTIGLTGIDNGFLLFNKTSGDTTNQALLETLTGSTLVVPSGDTRLCLNAVTGMTNNYIYPVEVVETTDDVGGYLKLCGGFYQGYYKLDGNSYEVLPNRVPKTWTAELWLRKPSEPNCSEYTGTTLNDDYSANTGFFLYFGTRAENKYWDIFEGLNTGTTSGCTSGATEWCTITKETDVSFVIDSGYRIPLSPPPIKITEIDNQFLIYGRASKNASCGACGAKTGLGNKTVRDFTGGSITISAITQEITNIENPFLIYGRANKNGSCGTCGAKTGFGDETVCSFSGMTAPLEELDRDADLIDNALGFRIREDGSIGYRKLVVTATCVNEVTVTACTIEESYSASGVVKDDQWSMVSIRFVANETYDDCELEWKPSRKGRLMFYVNRRLIFVVEEFDEFIARRLADYSEKQVAVPYNISLGGGTQGLIESMTFDGQDPRDMGSCLQNNFAGTFIGDISQFRFYICGMDYCDIKNNFEKERERYGLNVHD